VVHFLKVTKFVHDDVVLKVWRKKKDFVIKVEVF
tara:strand:- start:3513 stop:3614 length:102 start_codon:yes stop_codon:yes gene_type:complete